MQQSSLSRIIRSDINLLVTLYFLLKTKQVSKAARQMHLGQPAISHQLARLRELFDDQLLVRSANGMKLTPFAERLYPELEIVLANLEVLLDKRREVKPCSPQKEVYRVCVPEDIYINDVSVLFYNFVKRECIEQAVTFEVFTRYNQCITDLKNGNIDFFFGQCNALSDDICQSELIEMEYFLAVRQGHPLAEKVVDFNEIAQFPWIEVLFREQIQVLAEKLWGEAILNMKSVLKTSSTSAAVTLLRQSDAVCLFTEDLVNKENLSKIKVKGEKLTMMSYMYWHKAMNNDSFHKYIREHIIHRYISEHVLPK
ncbi:LysR family transcriptional regulator [Jinshanibacter sp. LJY008]|uniref:LysR family transcriptional regulator n=1 Tax=Limnobaculum eriocheiris TaxID=2897391 RepID=A0A9X1MUI9_9GAMM|nr:LysR family transcriptional regulator [Limnobaculum eriocheiris]MCD1124883.1 LysR family transcriptional regulator [Limnobaculum eriocheiris]